METFRYEIVGAGSSNENKINVSLSCETATTICCVCRTIYENTDTCTSEHRDEVQCFTVTSANTEVYWYPTATDDVRVYYHVDYECPEDTPLSCTAQCSGLTAYTVPAFVDEGYPDDIDIHYEYTSTCENGDYVGKREVIRGIKKVKLSDFRPTSTENELYYNLRIPSLSSSTCCSSTTVNEILKENKKCTDGNIAYIYFSFNPEVAQPTGSTINVEFSYRNVETVKDGDECRKRTTTGFFTIPWEIGECKQPSDAPDTYCCEDHEISGLTGTEKIRLSGKIDTDTEIYYNGEKVPDSGVSYSITQLGYNSLAGCAIDGNSIISSKGGDFQYINKINNICSPSCTSDESFGVKSGSVEVYYETSLYSNIWEKGNNKKVPSIGGRIMVKWGYVSHTILDNCEESFKEGTYEQIIMVGSCQEPPIDKVIYFKKQFKEFYKSEYLCSSPTKKSKLAIWKCGACGALSSTVSDSNCNGTEPTAPSTCSYCGASGSRLQLVKFDMSNAKPALNEGDDTVFNKITFDFKQDC